MPDYNEVLTPPDYRNLAINPGGESTIAASWSSSNGQISTGNMTVSPKSGTGHVTYSVTVNTPNSYYFGPLGPDASTVHQGVFLVPGGRQVSAKVQVRANVRVFVQMYARLLITTPSLFDDSLYIAELQTLPIGQLVEIPAESDWTPVAGRSDVLPSGSTHWQPVIAVFSSSTGTAPAVGTRVYADEMFVSETGFDTTTVGYLDGDVAGGYWEGEPSYSSSRTGTPPVAPDPPTGEVETGSEVDPDPDQPAQEAASDTPPDASPEPEPGPEFAASLLSADDVQQRPELNFRFRASPTQLCMRGDVQLSDLVMNTVDSFGVVWIVSDIEGWWTLPEVDVPDQPRAWFDGSYETRGRYLARNITINGSFIPRSVDDIASARDRLLRAANLCHIGGWLLTHQDASAAREDTRGSKVWLSGAPSIATVSQSGRTDFSIGLRAPDPIKYGIKDGVPPGYETLVLTTAQSDQPDRSFPRRYPWKYPGEVFGNTNGQAINRGNAVVFPVLKISGPTAGPVSVYNADTDQTFNITKKLFPGEQLVIDCATKQVSLNGAGNHRFYVDVNADWLMLQPGPNRLRFNETTFISNDTRLEVQWRSGWIG